MLLDNLSDDLLIEAYVKAKELNLDKDFRSLMMMEIQKRGIMNQLTDKI